MSKRRINRFECFASPLNGDSVSIIEEINSTYVEIYTRLFMDRHKGALANETDGIITLIELWLNSKTEFDVAWNPVFGLVRQATLFSLDPLSVAVLLSLHLNSTGIRSDWTARFAKPIRVRWSNVILPRAVSIRVENHKNKSAVILDGRAERRIVLSPAQSSRYLKSKGCGQFPSVRIGAKRLCVLLSDEPNNFGFETRSDSPVLRAATKSMERAFDILEKHAKPYVKWVNQVIREVVALRCRTGILRSNSSEEWPGKIQLSLPRRPIEIAEMLVHEASHQYFYLAQRFEAVSDGDDRKLYYSPVKGMDRPIDKILLAFHAFANVGLFYKSCIATGLDDRNYCKKNLERHLPELDELAEHLHSCNSLTKVGRALWEPLANSVF